jgi:hypothetical protein
MKSFKKFYSRINEKAEWAADLHEPITAALLTKQSDDLLDKCDKDTYTPEELKDILNTLKNNGSVDDVVGMSDKDKKSFDDDTQLPEIGQAISAAKSIKDKFGKIDKVYMTGKTWDKDIEKFKLTKYGMKDFNSSDVVVKNDNSFLGVSLKKKQSETAKDPTLLNKSFSDLLLSAPSENISGIIKELNNKQKEAFIKILSNPKVKDDILKELTVKNGYSNELIDYVTTTLNDKNLLSDGNTWAKVLGSSVDTGILNKNSKVKDNIRNIINDRLKTKDSFLSDIEDVIEKPEFAEFIGNSLVELLFKGSLQELKKLDFDFALCTGIAKLSKTKGITVKNAEYKELDTMLSKINDLAKDGKPILMLKGGKRFNFTGDEKATAAKINAILRIGNIDVADIEIRYKGKYTAYPQILGTMTDSFKKLLASSH